MVIKYSIGDLLYLREITIIKDTLKMIRQDQAQDKIQLLGHPIQFIHETNIEGKPEPLSPSVAEFFRKAQQNFHVHTSIDPTKVRCLSEVEAELVNSSGGN